MNIVESTSQQQIDLLCKLYEYKKEMDSQLVSIRSNLCRQPLSTRYFVQFQDLINGYYKTLNNIADNNNTELSGINKLQSFATKIKTFCDSIKSVVDKKVTQMNERSCDKIIELTNDVISYMKGENTDGK